MRGSPGTIAMSRWHRWRRGIALASAASFVAAGTLAVGGCTRGERRYQEVRNLGSDTMLEVAGAWAEAYDKVTDHIVVSVSGGGSGTGIAAVIVGKIDLANSSRKLKKEELARAHKNGSNPLEHHVGYDGIAIFVHRDNPLASITMDQLRQLFGDGGELHRWSQLGIDLGQGNDEIVLCSRQNNSGTYEYFRDAVLGGNTGRFKVECRNLNGSKDVVNVCGDVKSSLGYSGLAYANDRVRVVPVVRTAGGVPVVPTDDTIIRGEYPIARPLFMYTNGEPRGATKEYLDWIKSDDGQRVLRDHGYPPLRRLD
jgi:phosphate transport system substrate-binding protein